MSSRIQKPRPCVAATRSSSFTIKSRTDVTPMLRRSGLPVRAVIEGDVDGALGPGEEKTLPPRIFTYGVDGFAGRDPGDDFRPGGAAVVRAEDMRTKIVEPQAC